MAEFRILSLDGGGSWALIQVRTLIDIFNRTTGRDAASLKGHEVLKHFDFVAANSGGTLTLAGLLLDWPLAKLLSLFGDEAQRRAVFAPANVFDRLVDHLARPFGIGPKYSTAKKYEGLRTILGPNAAINVSEWPDRIGENYAGRRPQLLFMTHNYDAERATFVRSDHQSMSSSLSPHGECTLLDAVHASANPPVNFFDLPAGREGGGRFWDGAIAGYNNPVLAAVIETLANKTRYETTREEIKALSLGTGTTMLPISDDKPVKHPIVFAHKGRSSLLTDIRKLALSILDDPPDAATFHAHMMLDGPLPKHGDELPVDSPIVRMNPLIQPRKQNGEWTMPEGYDDKAFEDLVAVDMDAVSAKEVAIVQRFCDAWCDDRVPNQAVRADGKSFAAEIGHASFVDARAAAIARFGWPANKPYPAP